MMMMMTMMVAVMTRKKTGRKKWTRDHEGTSKHRDTKGKDRDRNIKRSKMLTVHLLSDFSELMGPEGRCRLWLRGNQRKR
jgi:hypothetical protein